MNSKETLQEMVERGSVAELARRIEAAEAVIDAANGPDSTRRSVEAIKAYESAYGAVNATYVPD